MLGYANTSTDANAAESPTLNQLVDRLKALKAQRQAHYEESLRLDEQVNQAEKAIHQAVAFLKDALEPTIKNPS